ncbi:MAG: hypothetical protein IKO78_01970 [Bacilli bacterium]|nr:hypothetical protein [Bacilli bacterium]
MKKYLYGLTVFALALFLVGCGGGDDVASHDKYNNKLECVHTYTSGEDKMVIYFDNDNKAIGLDYYSYADSDKVTEEQYNKVKERQCSGEGEWKKEWIKICDFTRNSEKVEAHIYVDNGEWFGEYNTKQDILDGKVDDLYSFTCK